MDYITPIIRDQAEVVKNNLKVTQEQNILNHKNTEMEKNVNRTVERLEEFKGYDKDILRVNKTQLA